MSRSRDVFTGTHTPDFECTCTDHFAILDLAALIAQRRCSFRIADDTPASRFGVGFWSMNSFAVTEIRGGGVAAPFHLDW